RLSILMAPITHQVGMEIASGVPAIQRKRLLAGRHTGDLVMRARPTQSSCPSTNRRTRYSLIRCVFAQGMQLRCTSRFGLPIRQASTSRSKLKQAKLTAIAFGHTPGQPMTMTTPIQDQNMATCDSELGLIRPAALIGRVVA